MVTNDGARLCLVQFIGRLPALITYPTARGRKIGGTSETLAPSKLSESDNLPNGPRPKNRWHERNDRAIEAIGI
ncbi:MAG: hypothetical protein EAY79_10050 [Runella slithyformis]|nr:MAG: hypothetical protein EAY79_10050 [Runella slithyformis]TAF00559.1 MAG: hypothetical protein EAZ80_03720 [Runella slithyformis]TAF44823.1 MAG: hypothetical protein EAZ63_11855 [Runella slithyformis]TAG51121.1 MAG: hypothetical protein EAZ29_10665 [Runella slithyformis]